MATLDGQNIFGVAVKMKVVSNPSAIQVVEFFGVDGLFGLYGGRRGLTVAISGVLVALDVGGINAAESAFASFDDGLGHTLLDTRGRSWSNIVFKGDFQPDDQGPRPANFPDGFGGRAAGWALPYKAMMIGMSS